MDNTQVEQERRRSLIGKRARKRVGSIEWCWQTLELVKLRWKRSNTVPQYLRRNYQELLDQRIWEKIPSRHPYGSLEAMLQAELGLGEEEFNHQLRLREQGGVAPQETTGDVLPVTPQETIGDVLPVTPQETTGDVLPVTPQETTGDVLPVAGDTDTSEAREEQAVLYVDTAQNERFKSDGIGRDTQTKLERLVRERPDLQEQIAMGHISIAQAFILAGLADGQFSIVNNAESAVETLTRRYSVEQLLRVFEGIGRHLLQHTKETTAQTFSRILGSEQPPSIQPLDSQDSGEQATSTLVEEETPEIASISDSTVSLQQETAPESVNGAPPPDDTVLAKQARVHIRNLSTKKAADTINQVRNESLRRRLHQELERHKQKRRERDRRRARQR